MPTENRSSNTELSKIVTEALVGMVSGVTGMKPPPGEPLPGFIQAPIDRAVTRISGFVAQPAPQPHPEPIAWMVGTAIWCTKEEAERDAAATGLPIVGLGPMSCAAPAEQHQGEPVAWLYSRPEGQVEPVVTLNKASAADRGSWDEAPLYTHAHSGEVERIEDERAEQWRLRRDAEADRDTKAAVIAELRTQLTERDALLREADEFMYIMTGHDSQPGSPISTARSGGMLSTSSGARSVPSYPPKQRRR
ncbi:hypothetical protein [Pseudomonas putida]|uniref:hypothetical protein n=1 Tax=Pseudomonas putida TaxID=303 RepID=UPI00384E9761